jgi:drug/metabolite transporter (DMT)-like permease
VRVTTQRLVKLGSLFVCLAAILWGFDGVVLTPRLFNLSVDYVVFVLHALPFLVMNVILWREYKTLRTLSSSDAFYMFLIALFGGALGTLAIVKALFLVQFQQLTVVALLQKLQPVFAVLLARLLLGERFGRNFVLWSALAVAGGYVLTFQFETPSLVSNGNMLPAALYSLFAAFAFGSSTVFGKRVLTRLPFQSALFFRYGLTALIMAVILAFTGGYDQFGKTTAVNWALFALIGATTGSGAILLYYFGLRYIRAAESTILELAFPVSTVVFDFLFNGTILSGVQWASAAVMFVALYKIGTGQGADPSDNVGAGEPVPAAVGE